MSLGISAADAKRLQKVKSMALKFDGRRGIRGLRFWQCFNPIALIKRFGLIAFIAFFFPAYVILRSLISSLATDPMVL